MRPIARANDCLCFFLECIAHAIRDQSSQDVVPYKIKEKGGCTLLVQELAFCAVRFQRPCVTHIHKKQSTAWIWVPSL